MRLLMILTFFKKNIRKKSYKGWVSISLFFLSITLHFRSRSTSSPRAALSLALPPPPPPVLPLPAQDRRMETLPWNKFSVNDQTLLFSKKHSLHSGGILFVKNKNQL
jgi:hypothetical protein